jgi:hypothetical protein
VAGAGHKSRRRAGEDGWLPVLALRGFNLNGAQVVAKGDQLRLPPATCEALLALGWVAPVLDEARP